MKSKDQEIEELKSEVDFLNSCLNNHKVTIAILLGFSEESVSIVSWDKIKQVIKQLNIERKNIERKLDIARTINTEMKKSIINILIDHNVLTEKN